MLQKSSIYQRILKKEVSPFNYIYIQILSSKTVFSPDNNKIHRKILSINNNW